MSASQLLTLINPVLAFLVATMFFLLWLNQRTRQYIIYFAAAFLLIAVSICAQVFIVPRDAGQNSIVVCILYLSSLIVLSGGITKRAEIDFDYLSYGLIFSVTTFLDYYFFYIKFDFAMRAYVLNFGAGAVMLVTAFKIRHFRRGSSIDSMLFWLLLLTGLHFFPRTILTLAPGTPNPDPVTFFASTFWLVFSLSAAIFFLAIAFLLLWAVASDIIADFKKVGSTDALTGLYNRRGFEELALEKIARKNRDAISLVFSDIDHFKRVNDMYGHASGDLVLRKFSSILSEEVRTVDVLGRFGGEEFVVLLANADRYVAQRFADRVRSRLRMAVFDDIPGSGNITASFGIAEYKPGETLMALVDRADKMVYAAKKAGRNRVCIDEPE
ncbi:MAG: GGDEF domain-containing protein [Parvibaculaceae bacterium]|nr:GGDEF domain-containing protein [Parvibaculaceae bacterium]